LTAPQGVLPLNFRKLDFAARRAALERVYGAGACGLGGMEEAAENRVDLMVEAAVGSLPLPLGLATGFLIDGSSYDLPLATEEASVIAAATYAAQLIRSEGGFSTWASDPVMRAQVFLEGVSPGGELELRGRGAEIGKELEILLGSMRLRGGGYRGLELERVSETGLLRVSILVDVRDAMGANVLNGAAEGMAGSLERLSGGSRLMCILSNDARDRRAGARFEIPAGRLRRGAFSGEEAARRIELASLLAQSDPERAVTHNKGVMNGITALALATGNDTRALEAAVHYWAGRGGSYRGVTTFRRVGEALEGTIELPLALGTVGGSVGLQPAAALSLRILRGPDGRGLCRIAAALGLAQNFAALFALVTEGIQSGHMRLHGRKGGSGE